MRVTRVVCARARDISWSNERSPESRDDPTISPDRGRMNTLVFFLPECEWLRDRELVVWGRKYLIRDVRLMEGIEITPLLPFIEKDFREKGLREVK